MTKQSTQLRTSIILLVATVALQSPCYAQFDIEEPAVAYSKTADDNRVTVLLTAVKNGETSLKVGS